jgi:hypothetical protein
LNASCADAVDTATAIAAAASNDRSPCRMVSSLISLPISCAAGFE